MFDDAKWSLAKVLERTEWDHGLVTLRVDATRDFRAGQFTKLGLAVDDVPVSRAYSIASAPGAPLDFYIVEVDGGALSPSICALRPGETIWVQRTCAGGFTLEKVPEGRDIWLIGTGTGLAPYISMLRHGDVFDRFDNIVVVQGARYARQFGHQPELHRWADEGRIRWIRTTTREAHPAALEGRITSLFAAGTLEAEAGLRMDAEHGHVMLCGNPAMIKEMRTMLKEQREMQLHTPRRHGQVHIERYW